MPKENAGAFFGKWWAPNNPLMQSYDRDKEAVWKPYFLTEEDENQVQEYETYDDTLYVAVRKGYDIRRFLQNISA